MGAEGIAAMSLTIRPTDSQTAPASLFSRKYVVHARLSLAVEDGRLTYAVEAVEPYERELPPEDNDYGFDENEPAVFLAEWDGEPAGRIRMVGWWNGFAYVDDVVVQPPFRGRGIGRALLERGIQWAREKGYPGIMLETQQDNAAACALYASCGFQLGGFDSFVYKAMQAENPQTALYWYLIFERRAG